MRRVFPLLIAFLLLHAVFSSAVLEQTLQLALGLRLVVAVLLLAVLGFLMGIPFPVGIRWAGRRQSSVVPWLWGINGVTSVLGSALATALAIHVGFRLTLIVSAVVYSTAALLILNAMRHAAPETEAANPPLPRGPDAPGLEMA